MADSYVCSKAKIKCSCGDKISTLTVYPDRTIWLTGEPQANISDHISMRNIAPFGKCHTTAYPATGAATAAAHGKLTPMPCVPNTPFPWMGGKNDVLLKGQPALLKSSSCRCVYGGTITFTYDGQVVGSGKDVEKEVKYSTEGLIKEAESSVTADNVLDGIQLALDIAGFVPGFGAVPDLVNAAISAMRGNWGEAGMSVLAAVPLIGDAAAGVKIAKKGYNAAKLSKMAKRSVGKNINLSKEYLMNKGMSREDAILFRRAVRNERRNVARQFYKDAGYKNVDSHLRGINFEKGVRVEMVPPPNKFYQYQRQSIKDGSLMRGSYYTIDKNATPSQLGIYDKFSFVDNGLEFDKELVEITNVTPQKALKSTAAKITDNWSVPGKSYSTEGGAIQYFMPIR